MSWQKNRRRKRVWYNHYAQLAERIKALASEGRPIAGEAILKMFYDLYEQRRLHKRQRIANSAYDSMMLAAQDTGLTSLALAPSTYNRVNISKPLVGALEMPVDPPKPAKGPSPLEAILADKTITLSKMKLYDAYPATIGIDLAAQMESRVIRLPASTPGVALDVAFTGQPTLEEITAQVRGRIEEIANQYIGMDSTVVAELVARQLADGSRKDEPVPYPKEII